MGPNSVRPSWRPRDLFRGALKGLPRSVRFEIYRKMLNVEYDPPPDVHFEVARCRPDLEGAFRLLHDRYVGAGLMEPHPSGMRVTVYHALPSTSTLVCKRGDQVIGTISVIRESALGFPLNQIFNTDHLKQDGARPAEFSSLAVRKSERGSGRILFPLFKYAYEYCRRYFGVDYLVIAVNPEQFDFYEAILLFSPLERRAVIEHYDFANGAPAMGGYVDLRSFDKHSAFQYGRRKDSQNLYKYFIESELDCFDFPDRKFFMIADPVMTPERLNYFFREKTNVLDNLGDRERAVLAGIYSSPDYRDIISPPDNPEAQLPERQESRFDVQIQGRLIVPPDKSVSLLVTNVSLSGFHAHLSEPLTIDSEVRINLSIAAYEIANLVAVPVWERGKNAYGFKVDRSSDNWKSFMTHLEQDLVTANRGRSALLAPLPSLNSDEES